MEGSRHFLRPGWREQKKDVGQTIGNDETQNQRLRYISLRHISASEDKCAMFVRLPDYFASEQ